MGSFNRRQEADDLTDYVNNGWLSSAEFDGPTFLWNHLIREASQEDAAQRNDVPVANLSDADVVINMPMQWYFDALASMVPTYSTADTVRPALQLIKTKPGNKIVSSCFIMVRPAASGENEVLAMADCAINIKPNEDELVEICKETVSCAKIFGVDPKVAFLSYSTLGSGKGEDVDKMRNACEKAKALMPDTPIGGEFQFDAAVSPAVAKTKHITDAVGGHANTFIFPDINAGNIGYKIAQRLGSFDAYGPILLGLNAPINDLSRGCNAQEVYSMAIITAALA